MLVLPALFLLGSLFLCGHVEAQSTAGEVLREAALQHDGPVTCDKWNCNCTFTRQRGCCCAANDMFQLEEHVFIRIHYLYERIYTLLDRVKDLEARRKVAFKASMDQNIAIVIPGSSEVCFGPFNTDVPIPYSSVSLNDDNGFNSGLGIFTAPLGGVYVFSTTVYSYVGVDGRLYHKVRLMKNGQGVVGVWEANREDGEDSATQVVVLDMQKGDQIYMELMSGRKLCKHLQYNIFTGYMLYPHLSE